MNKYQVSDYRNVDDLLKVLQDLANVDFYISLKLKLANLIHLLTYTCNDQACVKVYIRGDEIILELHTELPEVKNDILCIYKELDSVTRSSKDVLFEAMQRKEERLFKYKVLSKLKFLKGRIEPKSYGGDIVIPLINIAPR